jgi:hypothetical protein
MQQQTKAVRAIVTIAGPSKIPTAAVTGSLVYQLENKMLAIQRGFGVVEPSLRDPSPVALSYSTLIKRRPSSRPLQHQALLLAGLGARLARQQSSAGGVLKHLTNTLVGLGGALQVLVGANLLANLLALFRRDGLLASLPELLDRLLVVSQILLATNKDDGETLAEVKHLRDPLLLDVVERVRRVDSKANQNDMRVRVGQRTEAVVIFLASSIPKGELDVLAINLDIGNVVLEDGGDVDLREGTLGENNQQTGLTAGTVTDDDELSADLGHCVGRDVEALGRECGGSFEVARKGH